MNGEFSKLRIVASYGVCRRMLLVSVGQTLSKTFDLIKHTEAFKPIKSRLDVLILYKWKVSTNRI